MKKEFTICCYCEEEVEIFNCGKCKKQIKNSCKECHSEIVHGIMIPPGNVSFFDRTGFKHMRESQRSKMI